MSRSQAHPQVHSGGVPRGLLAAAGALVLFTFLASRPRAADRYRRGPYARRGAGRNVAAAFPGPTRWRRRGHRLQRRQGDLPSAAWQQRFHPRDDPRSDSRAPARGRRRDPSVRIDALERRHAVAGRFQHQAPDRPRCFRTHKFASLRATSSRHGVKRHEQIATPISDEHSRRRARSRSSTRPKACTPMSNSMAISRSSPGIRFWCMTRRPTCPSARRWSCAAPRRSSARGSPSVVWTRLAGNFELTELYDVSFTERRRL